MLDGSAYGLVLQPPPEDPDSVPAQEPKTVATAFSHLVRSARFAPRAVFSPSQIEKADADVVYKNYRGEDESNGCLQAWGYRYLEGLKEPDLEWHELPHDATPSQKARPFGKALHAQNENYYKGIPFDLSTEPGQRAHAGSHLLPHPTECEQVWTEQRLKLRTMPSAAAGYGSGISEPIAWNGSKDLTFFAKPGARFSTGFPWLIDYKTTKDFTAYQKDAAKLAKDGQAQLYALDVMLEYQLPQLPCRWVYYASPACKGPARALPTDFVARWAPALEVVQRMTDKAAELRAYITLYREKKIQVSDLPPQPLACKSFGGCPYGAGHKVRGPNDAKGKDTWVPMPGPCKNDVRYESEAHGGIILIGRLTHMTTQNAAPQSIAEKVAAATAAAQGQAAQGAGNHPGWVGTGAPGYPASAGAHLSQPLPNGGFPTQAQAPAGSAPVATPPIGAPLAPFQAPGSPAPAPTMFTPVPGLTPNTPAPAPSVPQAAPAPAPAAQRPQPPQGFGQQSPQNPDYFADGQGGWLDRANLFAACQYYGIDPNTIPGFAPAPVSHVNPPEAAQAGAPTPFQPPQATAPALPTGLAPAAPAAGKRKRRTKAQIAEDDAAIAAGQAPPHGGGKGSGAASAEEADEPAEALPPPDAWGISTDTTWAVKLKLTGPGGAILEVPCPSNMADQIGGYVAEQVKRLLG